MGSYNIYMCGVGGQGIGVLSEVLIQACLAAGSNVKGVDTHGLAQRGGIVVSHLRLGDELYTPKVPPGGADLVVALERLEAYRAVNRMLKPGGTVVYYDLELQPIHVRMGKSTYPSAADLAQAAGEMGAKVERVVVDNLGDPRMQNTALLGRIASLEVIPGVTAKVLESSLEAILPGSVIQENLEVFRSVAGKATG